MPIYSDTTRRVGVVMALLSAGGLLGIVVATAKAGPPAERVSLAAACASAVDPAATTTAVDPAAVDPAATTATADPAATAAAADPAVEAPGATEHPGDGQAAVAPADAAAPADGCATDGSVAAAPAGLAILGTDCSTSLLPAHDGFQNGGRCVATSFGEVGEESRNPTLLITSAPTAIRKGRPFTIRVSTRNLVRDRFLPAKEGGYYAESSFLTADGLARGHIHTACRMISAARRAPDPTPLPAFFVATEDGGGSASPDTVAVTVTTGLPVRGLAQCSVWAGDGSHRIPMMQRANQMPAFDSVRISVF